MRLCSSTTWLASKPHLIILVFLFFCFQLFPIVGHSEDTETFRKQEQRKIKQQIEENQIKIQQLQAGLEDQKEGAERTLLREKGILSELEDLDTRLLQLAARLRTLNLRKHEQAELIASKEEQLEDIRVKSLELQQHMEKRIGAYYKLGKIGLINITFSTQTMPDLLRFHDAFQAVIEYDQQIMAEYHKTIEELERAKDALTLERGLLDEFISQASDKEAAIKEARQEKALLLNRVKNQAALHDQAIHEIKDATQQLAASLLAMKKKEKLFDQGFLLNKGKHIPPLNGKVSSLFNQERINDFGISRKNPGIALDAPDGTKIVAIYPGKVVYSGYLKGYGNTVIIDHGYQYYSITSRIERLIVEKGANVKRNDIIGIMGSTATILDNGLYFEIRHNDEPLNPLSWLNRKKLRYINNLQ